MRRRNEAAVIWARRLNGWVAANSGGSNAPSFQRLVPREWGGDRSLRVRANPSPRKRLAPSSPASAWVCIENSFVHHFSSWTTLTIRSLNVVPILANSLEDFGDDTSLPITLEVLMQQTQSWLDQWKDPTQFSNPPTGIDVLLHQWSYTLRQIQDDPQRLRPAVKLVDEFARLLLSSPTTKQDLTSPNTNSIHQALAAVVTISGWARIAKLREGHGPDDNQGDAALSAQQIFDMLPFEWGRVPYDILRAAKNKRLDLYRALLLTWSRSKRWDACDRAQQCLDRLKEEERTSPLEGLWIDDQCYHLAMGAASAVGRAHLVLELMHEWHQERGMRAYSFSYDALLRAYQKMSEKDSQVAPLALAAWNEHLDLYRELKRQHGQPSPEDRPMAITFGRLLYLLKDNPDLAWNVLQQGIDFQGEHRECVDLIDSRAFTVTMKSFIAKGRLAEAEVLLGRMVKLYECGNQCLKPHPAAFGVVLEGLARQGRQESMAKAEALLKAMEKLFLAEGLLTAHSYNIMLQGYRIRGQLDKMREMLRYMEGLCGTDSGKQQLRPDAISYNLLMQAIWDQKGDPFRLEKIEAVFSNMKSEKKIRPNSHSYTVVLQAFAKARDKESLVRAEAIFREIREPNKIQSNTLLSAYMTQGQAEAAEKLLNRMWVDHEKRRDAVCRPDSVTYSTVLGAWRHSTRPDRWVRACALFEDMKRKYESGNRDCAPTAATESILLHVLASSDEANKHIIALKWLESFAYPSSDSVLIGFLRACMQTAGDYKTKLEAWRLAVGAFRKLSPVSKGSAMYTEMFDAYCRLLGESNFGDEEMKLEQETVRGIFHQCCRDGRVNAAVLEKVRQVFAPDLYWKLTLQHPELAPDLSRVRWEWLRHAKLPEKDIDVSRGYSE